MRLFVPQGVIDHPENGIHEVVGGTSVATRLEILQQDAEELRRLLIVIHHRLAHAISSIKTIDPAIKSDIDEVIVSVAEKYPLRSKVGGFCIRCGNVVPCASNNDTDTIFCAFGMCPNHCHMFFMVDIAYKAFKDVLAALRYNEEHGYKKAVQKERNKLDYIVRNSLLPEITELDSEIERKGKDDLVAKYPQLREIVENIERVHEEIEQWI